MKRSIWLLFASSCLWLAGCSEPAGGTGTGDDNGKPGGSLEEEYVEIPDPLFSAFLVKQFDKDKDGRISKAEAEEVTAIRVTENWEIASVEGIASFPNLKTFEFCGDFEHTRPLTGLDVSANTKLEVLNLSRNELESLDVHANTALRELNIAWNGVAAVDVSGNTALEVLNLGSNRLASVDVRANAALRELSVSGNEALAELDLSNNSGLEVLDCSGTRIPSVDVSAMAGLRRLSVGSGNITEIDVTHNPALEELNIVSCNMLSVDLSNNPELALIYAGLNKFTEFDISGCASRMEGVYCAGCPDLRTIYQRKGQKVETLLKDDTAEVVVK